MVESRMFSNTDLTYIRGHNTLNLIAMVGSRSILILDGSHYLLAKYLDSNTDEKLYSCDFVDINKGDGIEHLLCVGGELGVLKIINLTDGRLVNYYKGHTGAIHCIRTFKKYLVSCSEDSTIRIWDLEGGKCAVLMGGLLGHKDSVYTLDINRECRKLITAGSTFTIKEWAIKHKIEKYENTGELQFIGQPINSFEGIHRSPITGIEYYGNLIATLSNNVVYFIHNNKEEAELSYNNFKPPHSDCIFIGKVNMYDDCVGFKIQGHALIGLSSSGDMYLFDLKEIWDDSTPFIVESKLKNCINFIVFNGFVYVSTRDSIHRLFLDYSRFNEPD